ncbi:hypothetical protein GOODEAATRI_012133, partial [Goodea atripinnis]
ATLSMRSLVKEEPDWRTGIIASDRVGIVGGPLRLRRGSRFTWRKECQSIMESFFMENQYPDEGKREEIANACNSVIQKPGWKTFIFTQIISDLGFTRCISSLFISSHGRQSRRSRHFTIYYQASENKSKHGFD